MKIESKKVTIPAPAAEVFDYVTNLNNFENLLPRDRISEWESTEDYCSFKVQGTATIDLKLKSTEPPSKIVLESGDRAPFPILLEIFIKDTGDGSSEAYQHVNAEVNPFMKMVIQKPLSNLFDYIADRLREKFGD